MLYLSFILAPSLCWGFFPYINDKGQHRPVFSVEKPTKGGVDCGKWGNIMTSLSKMAALLGYDHLGIGSL